jgi:hypothetical protein
MNEVTASESRSSVQVGLHHPKPCVDLQGNPCLTGIWTAVARTLQTNAKRTCHDALGNEYPC